jgi:Putative Actinobacterial Holin-X, holin superfamily III
VAARQVGQAEGFLELAGRLIGDLGRLLDQRLELLKAELTREATSLAKSVGLLAVAVVGGSVGLAFLLLALGLWVGQLVGSTPGGLALVGAALAVAGLVLGLLAAKRLERQRLAPETMGELRRDAEWIRHGV